MSTIFEDLKGFKYLEPTTLKEACALLSEHREKASLIAGGTHLIPLLQEGRVKPEYLINIRNIPSLDTIGEYSEFSEDGIKIGALATLFDIARAALVHEKAVVLQEAIKLRELRTNKTRWAYHMSTLGGCLHSPQDAGDIAPALMILDAKAVVQGPQGWDTIPVEALFTQSDEERYKILTEIRIPKQQESEIGFVYEKSFGTGGAPSLGAAVLLKLDIKHVFVEELRIVVGGAGPVPIESKEGVAVMKENEIEDHLIIEAAELAADEICGKSDGEMVERARDLIEEAIRHAIDRSIGDFALGY
jgi:carbon-monoxide dehydrogenase medium subunit